MRSIMELGPYAIALVAGLLFSAATFAACHMLHGRRVRALMLRMEKSDRARQAAGQQAQQARKQVEQLQKELAAQHKARAQAVSARKRSLQLEQVLHEPRPLASSPLLDMEPPSMPTHGFADTMPFQDAAEAATPMKNPA
jgi:hypothetical protein